jgi:hypothetical protein
MWLAQNALVERSPDKRVRNECDDFELLFFFYHVCVEMELN